MICAISDPLGEILVSNIMGLGLMPIGRSTSRFARSMCSWNLTQALLLGAQVEILYNLSNVC